MRWIFGHVMLLRDAITYLCSYAILQGDNKAISFWRALLIPVSREMYSLH